MTLATSELVSLLSRTAGLLELADEGTLQDDERREVRDIMAEVADVEHEYNFQEVTYSFTLPCTVSLSGHPRNTSELLARLATALRDQLAEQSAEDIGSIIMDLHAVPDGNSVEV